MGICPSRRRAETAGPDEDDSADAVELRRRQALEDREVPEELLRLPRAPLYDDEGFALSPGGRNRRPSTYDHDVLAQEGQ